MKRGILLIVIPLVAVAVLIFATLASRGEYEWPYEHEDVEAITVCVSSESMESGKKYVTRADDLAAYLTMMDDMTIRGKYKEKDLWDGGHGYGVMIHLKDGRTLAYNFVDGGANHTALFSDGERRLMVGNLALKECWQTLIHCELLPMPQEEWENFPSIR